MMSTTHIKRRLHLLAGIFFVLSLAVMGSIGPFDKASAAAPSVVINVVPTTTSQQVMIKWTNPSSVDFTGTMVRYSTSGFPADTTAGTLAGDVAGLPNGNDLITVTGLSNGTVYYFSLFSHNAVPEYSTAVNTQQLVMGVAFSEDFQSRSVASIDGQNGWVKLGCTWDVADTSGEKTLKSNNVSAGYEVCRVANGGNVATYSDQMLRVDWKGSTTTTPGQVFLRSQSANSDAGGYFLWQSGGTIRITYKTTVGAPQVQLASVPFTPSVDTWYTYEFSIVNNSAGLPVLTGYVWQRGTSKPSMPTLQVTDTVNRHSQGVFTVGKTGTSVTEYDNITYSGMIGLSKADVVPASGANNLKWTNPIYPNYSGAIIRSSTSGFPVSPVDGNAVGNVAGSSGGTSTVAHTGLSNGTVYYYTIFPYDNSNVYGTPLRLVQVPQTFLFKDDFGGLSAGTVVGQNGWSKIAGTWDVTSLNADNVLAGTALTTYPTNMAVNGNVETTDQILTTRYRSDNVSNTAGYIWLRHQPNGYGYILWHNTNVWTISHLTGGGLVQLAAAPITAAPPTEANVWFNMEASIFNDNLGQPVIKLYVWKEGMEKPTTPTVMATDSIDRFVKGSFALGRNGGATTAYYDDVAFYGAAPTVGFSSPAAAVVGAPGVATRAIVDEGGTFYIPYIQTSPNLVLSANAGSIPAGGGVRFVLNEGLAGEQSLTDLSPPYSVTFPNLARAEYTADIYAIQSDGITPYIGSEYHDRRTDIAIGDIINVIGDSIGEGFYGNVDGGVVTSWLDADAGTVSLDNRQFPQHGIGTGTYNEGFLTDLNDELANYYGYPVFLMNEGRGGIRTFNYQSTVMTAGWQTRQAGLGANKWIVMLGVNDNRSADSPSTFQANMTTLLNTFISSYGASPDKIWLMYPLYDFGTGGQGAFASGLAAYPGVIDRIRNDMRLQGGADFFNTFKNYKLNEYADNVHPNVVGYQRMAKLIALSMMKPVFSSTSISNNQMTLSWNDLAAYEPSVAGYRVTYGKTPEANDFSLTTSETSLTIEALEPAADFYFKVNAFDNNSLATSASDFSETAGPFLSAGGRSHVTGSSGSATNGNQNPATTDTTNTTETSVSTDSTIDSTTDESESDTSTSTDTVQDGSMSGEAEATIFTDVSEHWAELEIGVLVEAGIVRGNPDGSFDPEGKLNRAEAAAMLWRVLGKSEVATDDDPFSDVSADTWYGPYIAGLHNLDLVNGNPDGTYLPAHEINRAEFLKLTMNVYLYLNPDFRSEYNAMIQAGVTGEYADLSADAWYAGVVTVASDLGFVEGSVCGYRTCFKPKASITRAEASKILYEMFE